MLPVIITYALTVVVTVTVVVANHVYSRMCVSRGTYSNISVPNHLKLINIYTYIDIPIFKYIDRMYTQVYIYTPMYG